MDEGGLWDKLTTFFRPGSLLCCDRAFRIKGRALFMRNCAAYILEDKQRYKRIFWLMRIQWLTFIIIRSRNLQLTLQFFLSRTRTSGGKRERIAETSNLIQYKYLFLYNIWVSWTQWISNNNDKISAITRWQEEGLKSRPISANGTVIWSHKPYNRHCTHVVNLGWWVTIIHCIKTKAWIKHDETPVDHGFAKENTSWYTCSHICEQIIASISNKSRNMAR